jgi:tRNA-dihydrouridine synthase B
VIANGDITSPQKARFVLDYTGADAIMIGRAAQGRPWIFREVVHYLATGELLAPPDLQQVRDIMLEHVQGLHQLYGEVLGPRIARKHVGWYLAEHDAEGAFRSEFNGIEQQQTQLDALWNYFEQLAAT